jgi:ADP-ribose pyrophosphatase
MTNDKRIIHRGNLITVCEERINLPNGNHTYFDIVKHPGGAVIAAINEQEEICLLKQWRHVLQKEIWELPAGCLEAHEAPMRTAQRELEEEAGVIAEHWRALGEVVASPGFSNEVLYFFEARTLTQGVINLDEAEQLEAHWIKLEEVYKMAKSGDITDAKTLALLLRL